MVDLSSSMTLIARDRHTRAIRQRAALLTALDLRPDWSSNAYAEYLVARLTVPPELLRQLQTQKGQEKYRAAYLIPDGRRGLSAGGCTRVWCKGPRTSRLKGWYLRTFGSESSVYTKPRMRAAPISFAP